MAGSGYTGSVTTFETLQAPGPIPNGAMRVTPLGGLGEVGRNMTVFEPRRSRWSEPRRHRPDGQRLFPLDSEG